jgi:hypothetical protein
MLTALKRSKLVLALAGSLLALALIPSAAGAQDIDCGDPGAPPNVAVGPTDPNGLDEDGDGIGCEEGEGASTASGGSLASTGFDAWMLFAGAGVALVGGLALNRAASAPGR